MCGEIKICVCLEMRNVKWKWRQKKMCNINNEFCWILMVSGVFPLVLKDRIFTMEIKIEIDDKFNKYVRKIRKIRIFK